MLGTSVSLTIYFCFSGMTALSTYFLTKELWNSGAGLFAACFIAIGRIISFLSGFFFICVTELVLLCKYACIAGVFQRHATFFSMPCYLLPVPGYISRSVAGSYDNEGIAIFALMFTYFLWVRYTAAVFLRNS